jgi:hypothetical protein
MTAFVVSKHCCVKTHIDPVRGAPGAVIVYKAIPQLNPSLRQEGLVLQGERKGCYIVVTAFGKGVIRTTQRIVGG